MGALEELVVDGRELDRELVAGFLKPFILIDRRALSVIPQDGWNSISNEGRILVYLVARKAMRALDLGLRREAATPQEIERATGIPGGSVRPALKRLLKMRLVERDIDGSYIVPSHAVAKARSAVAHPSRGVAA